MNTSDYGTLYGIGVGPGDPDLLTVKSVRVLQQVEIVFAASSTKNEHSQAVSIAAPHIPEKTEVRRLAFPMTKDRAEKQSCWKTHARTIIAELEKGQDVAFLTMGDSMTYATYGYILKYVLELAPAAPVVTIPGITAYQAAAARVNRPLVEGEESLLVVSGVEGGHRLRQYSDQIENVVFMKVYRNAGDIIDALGENRMLDSSVAVANCSLESEEVIRDVSSLKDRKPGYWTLVLAKKNKSDGTP
jgi:precorrin-2/cobalt-factor-2 C20-methyltransferase